MNRPLIVAAAMGFLFPAATMGAPPALSLDPVMWLDHEPEVVTEVREASPDSYGITGNWFGLRDTLAKNHFEVGGSVLFNVTKVLRGGLDTNAWPTSYLLDLYLIADLEGLIGLKGGMVFVDFQTHDQSENGDAAVGDIQGYDNLTAPRFIQFAQFWYKQSFDDVVWMKIGKIDANGDAGRAGDDAEIGFSMIEHTLDFQHGAAAYPAALWALPSYPAGAPGIELVIGKETYVGIGAFYSNIHQTFLSMSGHPEKVGTAAGGMFFIAEAGARWNWNTRPGHAGAGGWYHTGDFPRTDGTGESTGAGGGYFFIDQSLIHEETDRGTRDLGFFVSGAIANKVTSPIDQSLAAGLAAAGFIPGRPDDVVGIMTTWAHLPAQPGLLHSFELASEVFYKFQLTPWASVKPAFQYINHPSGTLPDAAVVTLRVEVDF